MTALALALAGATDAERPARDALPRATHAPGSSAARSPLERSVEGDGLARWMDGRIGGGEPFPGSAPGGTEGP